MSIAKLLERRTHQVPGKLKISEIFFEVPKDHASPNDEKLRLFARSVERFEKPVNPSREEKKQLPWFLYLQGGPGLPCRPPQNYAWVNSVLDKGYQMLFLDQRGTGLSSTITARTLAKKGSPAEQAAYLKCFRADSIVRDCEAIRKNLTADYPEEKQKWSILGQSFGSFCCVNYLSRFPEGLQEVFTCGGLPPLVCKPDAVYEKLYKKVEQRNQSYYQKFPEDIHHVKEIAKYLKAQDIVLPSGSKLTFLRFRQLGMYFSAHGGVDTVHDNVFRFISDLRQNGFLTRPTLTAFETQFPFDSMVMYALMHEPCYLQGAASNWSADRIMKTLPEFNVEEVEGDTPILFTGEMIFRAMFDDYIELQSLKEIADLLAQMDDWPDLYDTEQLAKNKVPVYSSTYVDDMCCHFDYTRETASRIQGCRQFVTNTMYHDALTSKSEDLMKELFALRDDVID